MAMPTATGVAKIIVLKSSMCKFHFKPDKASEKNTQEPATPPPQAPQAPGGTCHKAKIYANVVI